jgi:hypothetical protein
MRRRRDADILMIEWFHEWNQLFNWIPIYIGMTENDAGCHPGESRDPVLVFDPGFPGGAVHGLTPFEIAAR